MGITSQPNGSLQETTESRFKLWFKRVGWLVLIWFASVLALGVVALGLRLFMNLIGLKS
ncbi:DUF2474 domain-containing protein [Methyloradius palustris]|uniref:DUF2474 domain-containing protein n=1 Tax=Methyloradius palustris TaxID=2778876 RepID=UPI001C8BF54D|nr:DUF2474 domain-containing protein [Methyloradius palustris]